MLLVVWLVESDNGIESDSDVDAVLCVVSWSDNGIESEVMWMLLVVWLVESDNGIESDRVVEVVRCC